MTGAQQERFWAKVDPSGGCWRWNGARDRNGYGHLRVDGKTKQAHRIAYELLVGSIPEGLHLDHLCRNRACVRPDHCEPVPPRVNWERGESPTRKHALKTQCRAGHPYTPENTYLNSPGRRRCRECGRLRQAEHRIRRSWCCGTGVLQEAAKGQEAPGRP